MDIDDVNSCGTQWESLKITEDVEENYRFPMQLCTSCPIQKFPHTQRNSVSLIIDHTNIKY
jgi:hypothetical protein